jgi:hypothetical protein
MKLWIGQVHLTPSSRIRAPVIDVIVNCHGSPPGIRGLFDEIFRVIA